MIIFLLRRDFNGHEAMRYRIAALLLTSLVAFEGQRAKIPKVVSLPLIPAMQLLQDLWEWELAENENSLDFHIWVANRLPSRIFSFFRALISKLLISWSIEMRSCSQKLRLKFYSHSFLQCEANSWAPWWYVRSSLKGRIRGQLVIMT